MSKSGLLGCLLLSLLAGCGGGGSPTSTPDVKTPEVDQPQSDDSEEEPADAGEPETDTPAESEPEVEEPQAEETGEGDPEQEEPKVEEPPPENTAPKASVASPGVVYGGTVVSLDGSASMDEDGDELTYRWSVQGGANAHFVTEEGALRATLEAPSGQLLISASEAGEEIAVTLQVSDGTDTDSDTAVFAVAPCSERVGYLFTDCVDPAWLGPMAWDVNFLEVNENFGYYGGDTDNHVRWALVDGGRGDDGKVFDISFNKENWNGSFRLVPAGRAADPGASVDLSQFEEGELVFELRVVEPTDAEIYLAAECVYPCESTPRQVDSATDGSWSTIYVPLTEFAGMDWSNTSIPFAIYPEWGAQTDVRIQVDNIRFEGGVCREEENVLFGECLGPNWYTLAAVDDETTNTLGSIQEYRSGATDNHVQWRKQFSGSPGRGEVLSVAFTSEATNGHFYIRTESTASSNDLSDYLNGVLMFDINVQDYGASTGGLVVRVDTWWDGETSPEIPLPKSPVGEWATVAIPVADLLVGGGLDLSSVHAGFSIWPAGDQPGDQQGVEILLDNIRWEKLPEE